MSFEYHISVAISSRTMEIFEPQHHCKPDFWKYHLCPASMAGATTQDGFYQLLASTRYDPFLSSVGWNNDPSGPSPFLLLPYQYERLTSAAKIHNWHHVSSALTYLDLKNACQNGVSQQLNSERLQAGALRVRSINLPFYR